MKSLDLVGRTFGRLTVVSDWTTEEWRGTRVWRSRCACGVFILSTSSTLLEGKTRSCGCLRRELTGAKRRTHGGSHSHPLYRTWQGLINRCTNPNNASYKNYGGRGIEVCSRWRRDFGAFIADMGERPAGTSLDRIDNDGHYMPDNCRWATKTEQSQNRRKPRRAA